MTHTHHRRGSRQSLERDYVVLAMIDPEVKAQQEYRGDLENRVRIFLEICGRHHPVSLVGRASGERLRYMKGWEPRMDSGIHRSSTVGEIVKCEELSDLGIGHAVFDNREAVERVLKELKEADLGISIVVSGVFDEVFNICRNVGIAPHTVNMSLGTWGKTEFLPDPTVLEIGTMCGHAMISPRLAEAMIDRVKSNKISPEEAAVELGKQCTCNIYNPVRAAEIVRRAVGK